MLQDYTLGDIEAILRDTVVGVTGCWSEGACETMTRQGLASLVMVVPSNVWMYKEEEATSENVDRLRKVLRIEANRVRLERIEQLLGALEKAADMWKRGEQKHISLRTVGYSLTGEQVEKVEQVVNWVANHLAYSMKCAAPIYDRAEMLAEALYDMAITVGCGSWLRSGIGPGSSVGCDEMSVDEMSELIGENVSSIKQFIAACGTEEQQTRLVAAVDAVSQAFQDAVVSAYLAG